MKFFRQYVMTKKYILYPKRHPLKNVILQEIIIRSYSIPLKFYRPDLQRFQLHCYLTYFFKYIQNVCQLNNLLSRIKIIYQKRYFHWGQ